MSLGSIVFDQGRDAFMLLKPNRIMALTVRSLLVVSLLLVSSATATAQTTRDDSSNVIEVQAHELRQYKKS